jgi:hypothetical protein
MKKDMTCFDKAWLRRARRVVKNNHPEMGGLTVFEAREIVREFTGKYPYPKEPEK